MHPGFMHWWREAQRHAHSSSCHAEAGCGPGAGHGRHRRNGPAQFGHEDSPGLHAMEDGGGASFGVRRPLRFMAQRLKLREEQVAELAAILDELKTERAQAAVDHRRSVGSFADALAGDSFDSAAAAQAASSRVHSAERLREAVVRTLQRTHAMLDADQRKQLAYLLRSGQLTI